MRMQEGQILSKLFRPHQVYRQSCQIPKDPNYVRNLMRLAYQTATAKNIYPRAVFRQTLGTA